MPSNEFEWATVDASTAEARVPFPKDFEVQYRPAALHGNWMIYPGKYLVTCLGPYEYQSRRVAKPEVEWIPCSEVTAKALAENPTKYRVEYRHTPAGAGDSWCHYTGPGSIGCCGRIEFKFCELPPPVWSPAIWDDLIARTFREGQALAEGRWKPVRKAQADRMIDRGGYEVEFRVCKAVPLHVARDYEWHAYTPPVAPNSWRDKLHFRARLRRVISKRAGTVELDHGAWSVFSALVQERMRMHVHEVGSGPAAPPAPPVADDGWDYIMKDNADQRAGCMLFETQYAPSLQDESRARREDEWTPYNTPAPDSYRGRLVFRTRVRPGSVKVQAAPKARWSLMPWRALSAVAALLTTGAAKHGDRNYETATPGRDAIDLDAAMRHVVRYTNDPKGVDSESGQHHLAHAATRLLLIIERASK